MQYKECRRCHEEKPISEFCKSSNQRDGLQTWCKPCISKYKREQRSLRRSAEMQKRYDRINLNKEIVKNGNKQCSMCGRIKPLSDFWIGEGVGGYRAECAECRYARSVPDNYKYDIPHENRIAQKKAWDAISSGKIKRPSKCSVCGKTPSRKRAERIVFHHTDGYDEDHWYTGVFVCAHCHGEIHKDKIKVVGHNWLP